MLFGSTYASRDLLTHAASVIGNDMTDRHVLLEHRVLDASYWGRYLMGPGFAFLDNIPLYVDTLILLYSSLTSCRLDLLREISLILLETGLLEW
jgi:hypothetical protein